MSASSVCRGCGRPIQGEYLNALGATWHPEHFLCKGCGRPIGNTRFLLDNNAPYHADCYSQQVAPHCAYCARPLMGKYLIDHWGTKYCEEHQLYYSSCSFCGRLVAPQQQKAGELPVRCSVCRSSAIETIEEARPLFSRATRWVGSQGLQYHNLSMHLELCNRERLAELLQERSHAHSLGATTSSIYSQDGRVIRTEINGIAVLQGLPSTLFQGVAVHELGHVWMIVYGITHLPTWAEEGFCELLSYRYYNELHTPEGEYHAQSITQNPDPIYGNGFRQVRTLADAHGFARFLNIFRTTRQLPSR